MALVTTVARVVGITTVCLVATIPIITLVNELESFLSLPGITAISNPFVLQAVIFGSVFAGGGQPAHLL